MTDESIVDGHDFTSVVEIFPQEGGWFYLAVPRSISEQLGDRADRGVIAIAASVGSTTWDTSLLPIGDGSHFVALNARVRRAERLTLGDRVSAHVSLRER